MNQRRFIYYEFSNGIVILTYSDYLDLAKGRFWHETGVVSILTDFGPDKIREKKGPCLGLPMGEYICLFSVESNFHE